MYERFKEEEVKGGGCARSISRYGSVRGGNVTSVRCAITNSLHSLIVLRLRLITGTDPNVGN